MSKRHTTSRRRSYGRRQHEIHERADRRDRRAERGWRTSSDVEHGAWESPVADAPFGYAD